MGVFRLLRIEFQKLVTNKPLLFALIGVLLIPIVYVAVLLSAKWGPYDNMDNLPVAVVNNDVGAVSDGSPIQVGSDLVETLKTSSTLGWDFVTLEEAQKGLDQNDYYMIIEIPADFSQKVTTVMDANPQTPEIRYIKNEGMNFMAAQLKGGLQQVQAATAASPELQVVLTQLIAGADQLQAGITSLGSESSAGIGQISAGVQTAVGQLATGANSLSTGTSQLATGISQLAPGAQQVAGGVTSVKTGVEQLAPGAQQLSAGVGQVSAGINQLAPGSQALAQGLESAMPQVRTLGNGLRQLEAGQTTAVAGVNQLVAGQNELQAGAGQVAAGNASLLTSWGTLRQGLASLKDGTTQISNGNATVATGWTTLADGVSQVDAGVGRLQAGSQELSTALSAGSEQVGAVSVSDHNIAMFATPVNVVGENVNGYHYYRDSTAPYILSLALSFFIDFKQPATSPDSAISWYVSKWLKLSSFAVLQALLVTIFVLVALELTVSSIPLFILFALFVSLTFMSIIFFLVAVGNHIGRFIALAFIVLQLSITGSNLPIHMLPENLQTLSKFLPLTYSNAGFKAVISLGDTALLTSNAAVLAIFFGASSLLSFVVFLVSFKSMGTPKSPKIV